MEVAYRKNLGGSYMCVEEEGQLIEPYEVQMLEQYRIPCLLRMQTTISEGRRRYLYDISGKQQMTDYFSGKKLDMIRCVCFCFPFMMSAAGYRNICCGRRGCVWRWNIFM